MDIEIHEIMINKMVLNFKNESHNYEMSLYEKYLFDYLDNPSNEIISTEKELDEYNALIAEKTELENDVETLAEVMRMEEN